jgi:hypothetical protein
VILSVQVWGRPGCTAAENFHEPCRIKDAGVGLDRVTIGVENSVNKP